MFSKDVYSDLENLLVNLELPVLEDDGSNKDMFYGIETVSRESFAQNFGGYPRSDIAIINEQQNLQVAQTMLDKLPDFGSSDNPNAGKSDAQIMLGLQSKYMQSPSEILPYIEKEIQVRADKLEAERIEAERISQLQQSEKPDVTDIP